MAKSDFKDYICLPFCCFFRAAAKEELACQGARVVERLVASGVLDPSVLPGRELKKDRLWQESDALLDETVCGRCPFRAADCDYRALDRPADAEPCGGYLLLRILREAGMVSADDLEVNDG